MGTPELRRNPLSRWIADNSLEAALPNFFYERPAP